MYSKYMFFIARYEHVCGAGVSEQEEHSLMSPPENSSLLIGATLKRMPSFSASLVYMQHL